MNKRPGPKLIFDKNDWTIPKS